MFGKNMFIVILILAMLIPAVASAAAAVGEEEKDKRVVFKLNVKKGEVFQYRVRAELTLEVRKQGTDEKPLQKIEHILEMKFTQKCNIVENDGTMGFEVANDDYKLVRKLFGSDGKTTEEVYTPEGLTIRHDSGLVLSRKWSELPRSEQGEIRKVLARGYQFAATPNCEIKELFKSKVFEHELPGFHALRLQQAVYYPALPISKGTMWNWRESVDFPELRDHPLSGRKIPTNTEYEFIEEGDVSGIPCVTISVKSESKLEDKSAGTTFTRKLTEKAHMEKETGMAVLVEGSIKTELSAGGLSARLTTSIAGKFTISRITEPENKGD